MNLKNCTCGILSLFLLFPALSKADSSEASLKSFIKNFYEGYLSNESKSLEGAEFRNFFGADFVGSQVEIDIAGNVDFKRYDFAGFKESFEPYRMATGVVIKFTVTNFNKVVVKGSTGVVNMDMNFELRKNGNLLSKGEYTVSATTKIYDDKHWKLTFVNSLYVQSEVFAGKCLCDLFKQGEESFATFLTVPDGNRYETQTHRFTVKEAKSKRFITMDGDKRFVWDTKNNTLYYDEKKIADSVRQSPTAIANILRHLNAGKCQSVEVNN